MNTEIKSWKLWTALVTPMREDGQVDFAGLDTIVQKQEAAGNGILLLGSTGEGLALDADEKFDIVKHVSELKLQVPVMAGVGGYNLMVQKTWVRQCNAMNIDALLLVAPLYSKPGPVGLERWFRSLLDCSARPCMLYNIPSRTGIKIPPEVIGRLESHPNMWSLKEASGSVEEYRAFRNRTPDLSIFSGDDAMLPAFAAEGCHGLISVAANVWPEATGRYVELSLKGGESGSAFGQVWQRGAKALFSVSNPIPSKVLLVEKGWIKSPSLRLPLTPDELTDKELLFKADAAIMNWYSNEKNDLKQRH